MIGRLLVALGLAVISLAGATAQDRFAEAVWNTDLTKTTVDPSEIFTVIGKDDIPAIDNPRFRPAAEETRIAGNEPVVAFALDGIARAYPLRYLMWHEIVNDTVSGLPVAVTYCPLCNTSVVFERVLDGKPVTFGTTGKLRHSDLIMYDRGEENWWQQFNGEAIVGKRAGEKLNALPSTLISFDMFLGRYPQGEVLVPDPSRASRAGQNPYVNYDTAPIPFLFRGELPKDIRPMMRIALVHEPEPVAVSLPFLRENAPYRVGALEFRWQVGQASALDSETIASGRDVGSIEVVRRSKNGAEVPVVYLVTFAFAARAFSPGLEIIQ